MTGNRLYSSHTYQANKFSARETYIVTKKGLTGISKKPYIILVDLDLRNKNQERFAEHTSSEGEGQFLNSAPIGRKLAKTIAANP